MSFNKEGRFQVQAARMERARAVVPGDKKVHRCKVDGCDADLTLEGDYSKKHRACKLHRQVLDCMVQGTPSRWCQRCTKFHEVEVFESTKRSCRTSLHNLKGRRSRAKKQPMDSDSEPEPYVSPARSLSQTISQDTVSTHSAPPPQPQPRPKRQVQQRQLWRHDSNTSDATTSAPTEDPSPQPTLDIPSLNIAAAMEQALAAQYLLGVPQATYATEVQKAQDILQGLKATLDKPALTRAQAGLPPEEPQAVQHSDNSTPTWGSDAFARALQSVLSTQAAQLPAMMVPPSENSAAAESMLQQRQEEMAMQSCGQKRMPEELASQATKRPCIPTSAYDPAFSSIPPAPTTARSTPFKGDLQSLPLGVFDLPLTADVTAHVPGHLPLTVDVTAHAPGINTDAFIVSPAAVFSDSVPAAPGLSLVFPPASTSTSFVMPSLQPLDLEAPPLLNLLPLDLPSWDRTASELLDQALGTNTGGDHAFQSVLLGSQQNLGILC